MFETLSCAVTLSKAASTLCQAFQADQTVCLQICSSVCRKPFLKSAQKHVIMLRHERHALKHEHIGEAVCTYENLCVQGPGLTTIHADVAAGAPHQRKLCHA